MSNKQREAQSELKKFDLYFTSGNDVDVDIRISVPRDEWRALRDKVNAALAEPTGGQVTESIFDNGRVIVPLADIVFLDRYGADRKYLRAVFKNTTYNMEVGDYNNALHLDEPEGKALLAAWCHFRGELEASTLMKDSLSPLEIFERGMKSPSTALRAKNGG